jgi:hypothetical protein
MEISDKERIEKINRSAAEHLKDVFMQLENKEITEDDVLSLAYAGMISTKLLGYSPQAFARDAVLAAEKIQKMLEVDENEA